METLLSRPSKSDRQIRPAVPPKPRTLSFSPPDGRLEDNDSSGSWRTNNSEEDFFDPKLLMKKFQSKSVNYPFQHAVDYDG